MQMYVCELQIVQKRDKEIKDLQAQIHYNDITPKRDILGIWGNPKLRIFISLSVVGLLLYAKR